MATTKSTKTPTSPTDRVAKIRGDLAELTAERARIEALPVPLATARQRLQKELHAHAERYADRIHVGALAAKEWRVGALRAPHDGAESDPTLRGHTLLAALAWLAPEQLAATLEAKLGEHLEGRETISDTKRAEHLTDLEDNLGGLERAEEAAIREAEAATGAAIPRRGEASPAIVLALDPESESSEIDVARYVALAENCEQRFAAIRDLSERRREATEAASQMRSRLESLRRFGRPPSSYTMRDADGRLQIEISGGRSEEHAAAEVQRLEAERDRLSAELDRRAAEYAPLNALREGCERYLQAENVKVPGEAPFTALVPGFSGSATVQ